MCPCKSTWLWKESLNSDGQQFHQHQQNEQSSHTLNIKKTVTCDVGNPRPGLGVSQKYVAEINL